LIVASLERLHRGNPTSQGKYENVRRYNKGGEEKTREEKENKCE